MSLPVEVLVCHVLPQAATELEAVCLSGGEPLLWEGWQELLTFCRERGTIAVLKTNGILIDRLIARWLAEKQILLHISLDGTDSQMNDTIRGEGSFASTVEAIRTLQDMGAGEQISLSFTITAAIAECPDGIAALASELGVHSLRFSKLVLKGRARDLDPRLVPTQRQLIRFHRRMREFRADGYEISGTLDQALTTVPHQAACELGGILRIDPDGYVYPCLQLTERQFSIGRVSERSITEMLSSLNMRRLERVAQRRNRRLRCTSCFWRNYCEGGCMAAAYDAHGNLLADDPNCSLKIAWWEREALEHRGGTIAHGIHPSPPR